MEKNEILTASMLDILFDGRNKDYGAYQLRKSYDRRIVLALLLTASFVLAVFITISLANNLTPSLPPNQMLVQELFMEDLSQETVEEEIVVPETPPPAAVAEPPKMETIQFVNPKIVEDHLVQNPPPEQSELAEVKIGTFTQEGIKDVGIVAPTVKGVEGGMGVLEIPVSTTEDENKVFTKVEKEAFYPGGTKAWKRFLDRNLRPEVPIDKGAQPGSYQVVIQFVVKADGTVDDMKALTNHGFGMEEEAIRTLKKALKWEPAIQNGRNVSAYKKQPVTFVVQTD